MMKHTVFINVPKVFRGYVYTEGHSPLQLVICICFMDKVDVKQIDGLFWVVFLEGN